MVLLGRQGLRDELLDMLDGGLDVGVREAALVCLGVAESRVGCLELPGDEATAAVADKAAVQVTRAVAVSACAMVARIAMSHCHQADAATTLHANANIFEHTQKTKNRKTCCPADAFREYRVCKVSDIICPENKCPY